MRSISLLSKALAVTVYLVVLYSSCIACCAQNNSQAKAPQAAFSPAFTPPANFSKDYEFTCPGSFPSDLTIVNCRYTARDRLQQFVTTGITDQAMVLSVTGSLFTQAIKTPGEWPRTWKYYGYRVGSSYTQSVGNATAQLIVGSLLRDDPRHVQCERDPLLYGIQPAASATFHCTNMRRFGHALLDSITVRKSTEGLRPTDDEARFKAQLKSKYKRIPAISRLVGVYAGAYSQYPWEPRSANTFGAVSQRAALSFAPTFLGSFYTEYGTSLFSFLKKAKH